MDDDGDEMMTLAKCMETQRYLISAWHKPAIMKDVFDFDFDFKVTQKHSEYQNSVLIQKYRFQYKY